MTNAVLASVACCVGLAALVPATLPASDDRGNGSLRAPKNDDFSSGSLVMGSSSGSGGPSCAADLDGDLTVAGGDLSLLLSAWGTSGSDISGDGTCDGADLSILLGAWGPCPK